MKKALVITYYWPPAGGSGVQRWLKFVKYFRKYGIEPVVYTPENPEMMAEDCALLDEIPSGVSVIKRRIIEPYNLYKIISGKRGEKIKPGFITEKGKSNKKSLPEKLSLFIRSNVFIPDPKALWIFPSVRFLKRYLKEMPVDVIISTGPPHSMHLIARKVAGSLKIPWIADFRDPWTGMYTFKYMNNTSLTRMIHRRMEKGVVGDADAVVVVTNFMKEEFLSLKPKRIEVITNGFDREDFKNKEFPPEGKFTLTYTGLFVKDRNPSVLWRILGEKVQESRKFAEDLLIRIIGHTDSVVWEEITACGLEENLFRKDYVPHKEAIDWQQKTRVLLLAGGQEPEAKGILTGKFFEYLASGKRILGFGPKGGDLDIVLEESGAGEMFDYKDYPGVKKWIEQEYGKFLAGEEERNPLNGNDKYSREYLCGKMSKLIEEVILKRE